MNRTVCAAITLASTAAAAAPLPLGFDALHWGMTRQQAADALPFLKAAIALRPPPLASGSVEISGGGYAWHECRFAVFFKFESDALVDLKAVQTGSSQACHDDALAAFTEAYGTPQVKPMMGLYFYRWTGDGETTPALDLADKGLVAPNAFGVNANLHKTGAP